ncbi:MAG: phosphate acetyltransferase [Candidatus Omnitrophota bacterium]
MNNIVQKIRERAKTELKTIVLPEPEDPRIREAAEIIVRERIARVLLLSSELMDAKAKEEYAQDFFNLRKDKGITIEEAGKIVSDPLYYAAMMVRNSAADGFVAGARYTTSAVARAAIRCFEVDPQIRVASSCFIMVLPDSSLYEQRVFIFADCGIVPNPNSQQLSCIAISAAELFQEVLQADARIALLSYSTRGSGQGRDVRDVREAVRLVRQMRPELLVDGEIQVDAAIVPEVAKIKNSDDVLGGRANVLIFPNLNAGNISYKLVQRLTGARAIGPIILGLNRPCSDLSRGCLVDDIVDCVAVTAIKAQSRI